jgi:hypothetical protein
MTDPTTQPPTLYEWAGGMPAFERLTTVFYERVLADALIGPLFAQMNAKHPAYVAHFELGLELRALSVSSSRFSPSSSWRGSALEAHAPPPSSRASAASRGICTSVGRYCLGVHAENCRGAENGNGN